MSETIRAREFIVVDDQGNDKARFASRDGAVVLEMGDPSGPSASLAVEECGRTRFEFRVGSRTIQLLIDNHRARIKLKNQENESTCGLRLDGLGAWVYAESQPDIGVRLLSNCGGRDALLWLSETCYEKCGDTIVRSRCVRPNPTQDSTRGWQVCG